MKLYFNSNANLSTAVQSISSMYKTAPRLLPPCTTVSKHRKRGSHFRPSGLCSLAETRSNASCSLTPELNKPHERNTECLKNLVLPWRFTRQGYQICTKLFNHIFILLPKSWFNSSKYCITLTYTTESILDGNMLLSAKTSRLWKQKQKIALTFARRP